MSMIMTKIINKGDIMTEKLYEKNPYQAEFKADVLSIEKKEDKYHVILNQTCFYPEGGGQPSDKGEIAGIDVNMVYKDNDEVIHVLSKKPQKKKGLACKVDWTRRFDFMQQHTGQHLLSAVFKNQFNLNTVGFNLSKDSLRIDLDQQINKNKIDLVEKMVNDYIYNNKEVETLYPNSDDLKDLNLRKEPTVNENIRVIKIGEMDYSPCGGTHLKSTAELGMIKIVNVDNYKGGLRIDFVCGNRALKDYNFKNDIITKLRDITSIPNEELISEIKRIKAELDEKDEKIKDMNKKLLAFKADDLLNKADIIKDKKVIKEVFKDTTYNDVQWLSDIITKNDDIICIFGQQEASTARLLFSKSENIAEIKMNEIIKTPLEYIDGRGGGNSIKAQGGGNKVKKVKEAVDKGFEIVKNIL